MVRTDVDCKVSLFELSAKPLDLQSVKPIHAVWGVEISRSNGTRARYVPQRAAVDLIRLASPAIDDWF
jgi:hypothetical protein